MFTKKAENSDLRLVDVYVTAILYSALSLSTTVLLLIFLYAAVGTIRTIINITGRHIASDDRLKFHENMGSSFTKVFTKVILIMLDKSSDNTDV